MAGSPHSTADVLRRSLIGLAVLCGIGTTLELVLLRHWTNLLELIPFMSLAILAVAVALLIRRPRRRTVLVARTLATVVGASGIVGVLVHVRQNYESAPL